MWGRTGRFCFSEQTLNDTIRSISGLSSTGHGQTAKTATQISHTDLESSNLQSLPKVVIDPSSLLLTVKIKSFEVNLVWVDRIPKSSGLADNFIQWEKLATS